MNDSERTKAIRYIVIFSVLVNVVAWIGPLLGGDPTSPGLDTERRCHTLDRRLLPLPHSVDSAPLWGDGYPPVSALKPSRTGTNWHILDRHPVGRSDSDS